MTAKDVAKEIIVDWVDHHDRVILEGIANGITSWYFTNPLTNPNDTGRDAFRRVPKDELDWLLDRLTLELDSRILYFKADEFVHHVYRECGLE